MDIRKFFGSGGSSQPPKAPNQQQPSTSTKPPARSAASFDLDSDSDEDIVVLKKPTARPSALVQLPAPSPAVKPSSNTKLSNDRDGQKKGERPGVKRKRFQESDSYSSDSDSSSDSSDSDSSGSDSFFSEDDFAGAPVKSNRAANKAEKNAKKAAPKTTPTKGRGKASKMGNASSGSDDDSSSKTAQKKPTTPKPKKASAPPNITADYDYHDIAIAMEPLPPAPKTVFDPTQGKVVPVWLAANTPKPPPPYHGQRACPIGSSTSFSTGGGGPAAKKRTSPLTFVITGTLKSLMREECENLIKSLGGKITGTPSGRTDFVIVGEEPGPSKVNKAIENSTYIIDEDGLFRLILKKNPGLRQPNGLMLDNDEPSHSRDSNMTDGLSTSAQPPAPVITPAPVAAPAPAAKKGSLYAKKAAAAATGTTTATTPPASLTQTQSQSQSQSQSLNSLETPTQSFSLPDHQLSNSSTEVAAPVKKPSLYSKKSTSSTLSTTTTTTTTTTSTINPIPAQLSGAATIVDNNQGLGQHRIQSFDATHLPTITTYPGTTENDLWVDRFKPQSASEILGNNSYVSEIVEWLKKWNYYNKNDMFESGAANPKSRDTEPLRRAIMLSGGPGTGKTTAALLCAKAAGLNPIHFNASDTRSAKNIQAQVGELRNNLTLAHFNIGAPKPKQSSSTPGTGTVIVMDEVDGVSASDRGGVAELIKIIKETQAPIICICNDARSDKVKSLKNYCRSYSWQRPRANQITKRLRDIALSQGLQVQETALEAIYKNTNSDLRATINYLQMMATTRFGTVVTFDDAKVQKHDNVKDMEQGPFEIVPSFFAMKTAAHKGWFNEFMNNVDISQDLFPLFVFENYLRARPASNFGRAVPALVPGQPEPKIAPKQSYQPKLTSTKSNKNPFIADLSITFPPPPPTSPSSPRLIIPPPSSSLTPDRKTALRNMSITSLALDAMSSAITMDQAMMEEGAFHLWNSHSAMGVIYPGQAMGGGCSGRIDFPSLLGKMSSVNKAIRVATLIRTFFSILSTPLSKRELIIHYLPTFHSKLLSVLMGNLSFSVQDVRRCYGDDYCDLFKADRYLTGPPAIAHLLSFLGMTKEDFDLMLEPIDNITQSANDAVTTATAPPALVRSPNIAFPKLPHALTEAMLLTKQEKKSLLIYSNIQTSVKSTLTRALNKLSDSTRASKKKSAASKQGGGRSGPLTEEQELELANNEFSLTDDEQQDEGSENDNDGDGPQVTTTTTSTTKKTASTTRGVKKQKS